MGGRCRRWGGFVTCCLHGFDALLWVIGHLVRNCGFDGCWWDGDSGLRGRGRRWS